MVNAIKHYSGGCGWLPSQPFWVKLSKFNFSSWVQYHTTFWSNLGYHTTLSMVALYYINTSETPGELSHVNMISSQVKITWYLHTWKYQVVVTSLKIAIAIAIAIGTWSLSPRKSSVTIGNLRRSSEEVRKIFENVRRAFETRKCAFSYQYETINYVFYPSSLSNFSLSGVDSMVWVQPLCVLWIQFWKIFGNLRKVVRNLRKIVKNVVISMFI